MKLNASELVCIVKDTEYHISTSDGNDGDSIPKWFHDQIVEKLKNPASKQYTFSQYEQKKLRDFLIEKKLITTDKICCCVDSYAELGFVKGAIYKVFLRSFESIVQIDEQDPRFKHLSKRADGLDDKIVTIQDNQSMLTEQLVSTQCEYDMRNQIESFNPSYQLDSLGSINTNDYYQFNDK